MTKTEHVVFFGKSYRWVVIGGQLQLQPNLADRALFSNTSRRLYREYLSQAPFIESGPPATYCTRCGMDRVPAPTSLMIDPVCDRCMGELLWGKSMLAAHAADSWGWFKRRLQGHQLDLYLENYYGPHPWG